MAARHQGIQTSFRKGQLAGEHAADAANKVRWPTDGGRPDTRLGTNETVVGNIHQYNFGLQTDIRFRPGQNCAEARQAEGCPLDELAVPSENQHGYIIEVPASRRVRGQAANRPTPRIRRTW